MAFNKFTVSEEVEAVSKKNQAKIQQVLKTANKKSVEDLTEEEKEKLDIYLSGS